MQRWSNWAPNGSGCSLLTATLFLQRYALT